MNYVNPDTEEIITAYLFVATMLYSHKSYVEAAVDMMEKTWLKCHVTCLSILEEHLPELFVIT